MPTPLLPVQTLTATLMFPSPPVRAPEGTEITISAPSGTGTVDYTYSPLSQVQDGTATWVTGGIWSGSNTSVTTPLKVWHSCFVRVTCSSGSVSATVNPQGNAVAFPAPPLVSGGDLAGMSAALIAGSPTDQSTFQNLASGGPGRQSSCIVSDVGMLSAPTGGFKGGTMWEQTIMLPSGVDSVAVALYSDVADVSTYTGIKASVQTTTAANLINPSDGAAMVPVTFGGAANPTFVPGTAADPVPIWSDFMPVVNRGPGINYLITRVWYPATVANGGGSYNTNPTASRATKMQALGVNALYGYWGSDQTANNAASSTPTAASLPIAVVANFRKRVPVVWQFGDSTRQGWYADGVVSAIERWGIARNLAGNSVSVSNQAYSGQTSAQYLARLKRMVANGYRCDVLIYQIASPNDSWSSAISAAQISRAHEAIAIAQKMGAVIVLDGPFPQTSSTPSAAQIQVVTAAQQFGLDMQSSGGRIIFADYSALHASTQFGQWASGYNYDTLHQNEAATAGPILTAISAAMAKTGI